MPLDCFWRSIISEYRNAKVQNILAMAGLILICELVYFMYGKLMEYTTNIKCCQD